MPQGCAAARPPRPAAPYPRRLRFADGAATLPPLWFAPYIARAPVSLEAPVSLKGPAAGTLLR
jgi:hypothetical protein